jgi:hypothetical protein
MASLISDPTLAHVPCSKAKFRLLLKDFVTSPAIGVISVASRERIELLPKDCLWPNHFFLPYFLQPTSLSPSLHANDFECYADFDAMNTL